MTDECDGEFFSEHVWPLLAKDVRMLLVDESSSIQPSQVEAIVRPVFVQRRYRMSQFLESATPHQKPPSPERERYRVAMQCHALMYDTTIAATRALIDGDRAKEGDK